MIRAQLRKWVFKLAVAREVPTWATRLSLLLSRMEAVESKLAVLCSRVEDLDRTALVAVERSEVSSKAATLDVRAHNNVVVCTSLDARLAGVLPVERAEKP
ncbi:MAG: hypothetical protein IPK82_20230 [Polyangiaceae bacterium]|nr:hypothetical protein [Polyangiaceae bacterium]